MLGAHFSLTANVPAKAGKAWLLWPFAADSTARLNLPPDPGYPDPTAWLVPLVVDSSIFSILLYALYFGRWAVLPILLDLLLLSGVLFPGWILSALGAAA